MKMITSVYPCTFTHILNKEFYVYDKVTYSELKL